MVNIVRYDDTDAFGNNLLTIRATFKNEQGEVVPPEQAPIITKAAIKIGISILKEFKNPTFPLRVDLNSAETALLSPGNDIYMACWDENNLKYTCKGTINVTSSPRRV